MSLLDVNAFVTSLNPANAVPSLARLPRGQVTVNGTVLTGVIEAEVTNASHFTADTFRVVAASSGLPPGLGPAYWSSSVNDQLGISIGFDDGSGNTSLTPLILGQIDNAEYDPTRRTVTLSGRDLSAQLIDTKTAEKFQNLKSHQIAQALALRHGLDSTVTATTTQVGTYYEIDHVVLTREQSEWDLLVYLAEREGFDCWVRNTTLYFQPSPLPASTPYVLVWSEPAAGSLAANMTTLQLQRSQTLARDVIVKVRSWNQSQEKAFTVTYKASQAFKSQRAGGQGQTYSYTVPNLTRDQALQYAQKKAEEITRHERVLTARLPGDGILTTRTMVRLVGTATAWDQAYYPDTVTRKLSFQEGYTMELRAKNHSTQSTVVL
jgi:hypothetical protein